MTPIHTLTPRQARLLRLNAQRLAQHSADSPAGVLHHLCGVQAQDLPSGLLAIRARSQGLTAAQVEEARNRARARNGARARNKAPAHNEAPARSEEPALAWIWCLRGTLHLVTAEDARWLVPLLAPALIAGDARRMAQLGWDEDSAARGIELARQAVQQHGPLTRAEITHLLEEHHLPHEGQAPVHLLFRAVMQGVLCSGPDRGKEHTYAQFGQWLGEPLTLAREDGYAQIAMRFLQAYAPAAPEDLAIWSALKRSEAREAWQLIADQLVEVRILDEGQPTSGADKAKTGKAAQNSGQSAWMLTAQLPWLDEPTPDHPVVNLLPRFDTLWMGYANRDWLVDPALTTRINTGGGVINPILLVDGRALGTWKTARKRKALVVQVKPFEPLSAEVLAGIEAEVADMARFLEEEVTFDRSALA